MVKYLVLSFCILLACLCHGQTYRFRVYRTAACQTKPYLDSDYSLYKIPSKSDSAYAPKACTVYLPGPGRYRLFLGDAPQLDTSFEVRDTGLVVFNYKEPDVGFYYTNAVDVGGRY